MRATGDIDMEHRETMAEGAVLDSLQDWYAARCDGTWEHQYGVRIESLDNPGWRVEIDLIGTAMTEESFRRVESNDSADDWLTCWVENHKFHAACSPRNLSRVLNIFHTAAQ